MCDPAATRGRGPTGQGIRKMDEIAVAVVGFGSMGVHHCRQIMQVPGLRLRGVCDTDPRRREEAEQKLKVKSYGSMEEVLDDGAVALIVLVTAHHTHADLAIQALSRGRHVVVEKAMCLNVKQADQMIEAAKRAGKTLTVHQNRRMDSDYLTAKRVMDSGLLGAVYRIEAACNYRSPQGGWRARRDCGGGYLYDAGAHMADQLVQLARSRVKTVFADLQTRVWTDVMDTETYANVTVRFENGLVGVLDISGIMWYRKPRFLIMGENGTFVAVAGDDFGKATCCLYTEVAGLPARVEIESAKTGDFKTNMENYYRRLADHLLRGGEVPVDPGQVRESIKILEAAYVSAETGQSVDVSPW